MIPHFVSSNAFAEGSKIEIATGFYSLTGKTRTSQGSLSGVGSYRVGYRKSVGSRLDLGIGYNILYSSIFTGDSAYGLDVGLTYFPFSLAGAIEYEVGGQRMVLQPDFRPFAAVYFTQRSIQSVQTGYAGFGIGIGAEKTWTGNTSFVTTLRYTTMGGTATATATIIDFLFGLAWGF